MKLHISSLTQGSIQYYITNVEHDYWNKKLNLEKNQKLLDRLCFQEKQTALAKLAKQRRREYQVSRLMLREVIDLDLEQLIVLCSQNHTPLWNISLPHMYFSLTHTRNWIGIFTSSNHIIGSDMELAKRRIHENLIYRALQDFHLNSTQYQLTPMELWVIAEACFKCLSQRLGNNWPVVWKKLYFEPDSSDRKNFRFLYNDSQVQIHGSVNCWQQQVNLTPDFDDEFILAVAVIPVE